MTTYISDSWARIVLRDPELKKEKNGAFAKHLREIVRPTQIGYQRLMAFSNGNPVGIECKDKSDDRWACILQEMSDSENYSYRIQYFDQHGFSGHFCFKTIEAAAEALIKEKYLVIDQGAIDRLSTTDSWAIGVMRSEIRTLYNRGQISWSELMERFSTVSI